MSKTFSVFISYSRHDIDVARELQTFLASKGYTVWIDLAGIQGGQDYMQRIHLAIMDSQAMVLLISKDSQNSEWVLKELTLAIKNRKQVVPVLIDGYGITNPSFDLALANINILDAARDMPEACLQIAESLSGGEPATPIKTKRRRTVLLAAMAFLVCLTLGLTILFVARHKSDSPLPTIFPLTPTVMVTPPPTPAPTATMTPSPTATLTTTASSTDTPAPESTHRLCRIIVSVGNVRSEPSVEHRKIASVYFGEQYTVYDTQIGTNGNLWYKIRIGGEYGWISSGIATE